MTHFCDNDCRTQYHYGFNCRNGSNNWDKPDPPWQERGFWGGGIVLDEDDLQRIACYSANYRAGWQAADKLRSKVDNHASRDILKS